MHTLSLLLEKTVTLPTVHNLQERNILHVNRLENLFVPNVDMVTPLLCITVNGVEKIYENIGTASDPAINVAVSSGGKMVNLMVQVKKGHGKLELSRKSLHLMDEHYNVNEIINPKKQIKKTFTQQDINVALRHKKPTMGIVAEKNLENSARRDAPEIVNLRINPIKLNPIVVNDTDSSEYVKETYVDVNVDPVDKNSFYDAEYIVNEALNANKPVSWYIRPLFETPKNINFVEIFKKELLLKECLKNKIALRVEALKQIFTKKNHVSCFVDTKNNILEIKDNNNNPVLFFYKGKLAGYPIVEGVNVVIVTEQFTDVVVDDRKKINLVKQLISSADASVLEEDTLSTYFSSPLNFTPVTQEMYFSAPSVTKRYNYTVNSKERNIRVVDVMTGSIARIELAANESFSYAPFFQGDHLIVNTMELKDYSDAVAQVGYMYKTKKYMGPSFTEVQENVITRVEQYNYILEDVLKKEEEQLTHQHGIGSDRVAGDSDNPNFNAYPLLSLINDSITYLRLIAPPLTTPITRILYVQDGADAETLNPPHNPFQVIA
jgi:hypothetical protein